MLEVAPRDTHHHLSVGVQRPSHQPGAYLVNASLVTIHLPVASNKELASHVNDFEEFTVWKKNETKFTKFLFLKIFLD